MEKILHQLIGGLSHSFDSTIKGRAVSWAQHIWNQSAGPLQPPTWQVHLLFGHGLVSLGTALITLWCRHVGRWRMTWENLPKQVQLSMMKRALKNHNIGDGCILCIYIYKYNCIYIYTLDYEQNNTRTITDMQETWRNGQPWPTGCVMGRPFGWLPKATIIRSLLYSESIIVYTPSIGLVTR
jgi:hypothetical protein